jgi:hypothetical protein
MPAFADVTLTPQERDNLGIVTEAFGFSEITANWPASGQVLDASSLIASLGDLRTAELTAIASRQEATRTELLYRDDKNVARKVFDAARIQAETDATRVATLKGQLLATWGSGIANLSAAARAALSKELLNGRASLVRADQLYAATAGASIKSASVSTLDTREQWSAQWLGLLPQTAGATLGGASLLRVPAALAAGRPLTVMLLGGGEVTRSPSVPAPAVIRWHGAEWIYQETSANHFERLAVQSGPRSDGRAIVAGGAAPKGKVVIVGARALLAAELGASDAEGEAGAE